MKLTIRRAKLSDFDSIQKLNKQLFDFEEQFGHGYNLNWPYEEAGISYFQKRLESEEKSIIFVAEDNEVLVGYVIACVFQLPFRRANSICEIENMFVLETHRGQQIGSQLIKAVQKEAKKRGVAKLRVGAIAQNERALAFYRRHGFGDMNLYLEVKV